MNDLRKALFRALEKSDINMLRAVLAQGASLACEAGDPDPACFVGAPYDGVYFEALKFLHSVGADLSAREPEFQDSLLHWATVNTDEDLLPWLIAQGLDVNAVNSKGRTPIVFAICALMPHCDAETHARAMRDVRCLVEAGADVNIRDEDETLLYYAAQTGLPELVGYLLAHGAVPSARNAKKQTPLHAIAFLAPACVLPGHLTIVEQLIAAGADIDALDEDGHSPLTCTYVAANTVAARKFIACGADIDSNAGMPLRMMMTDDCGDIIDMLIAAGAILDTAHGDEHLAPVGLAANNDCLHGVTALLDRGVDIEVENVDGETPLLLAAWRGNHDVVERLLARGANRHHIDHYDNTALSWAHRRRDARLIALLTS